VDRGRALRCAALAADVGEAMPGTAPLARGWVAIEQWGPYGRDALLDSHFPRPVGEWLKGQLAALEIKPVLIRPAGAHADRKGANAPRRVFLASSVPGASTLASFTIQHPDELYEVDYHAITTGRIDQAYPGIQIESEPLLLICSHAKRDICCAQRGRPIAKELARRLEVAGMSPQQAVWECSHIGGHRFAPVGLQLPHGWVHGRFDIEHAAAIFADAQVGRVSVGHARGRSSQDHPTQVAEIAARKLAEVTSIDSVNAVGLGGNRFRIAEHKGSEIDIEVAAVPGLEPRPESCSKTPEPWLNWVIRPV
jgi:hypothetical protein